MSGSDLLVAIIVILIGTASVLGYLVFQQQDQQQTLPEQEQDENERLMVELRAASSEGLELPVARRQQVAEVAKEAEYLDITECKPNPAILRLKPGENFTIRNQDTISHSLFIFLGQFNETVFDAPPGTVKTFEVNFEKGEGFYGYHCDSVSGLAGIIVVLS